MILRNHKENDGNLNWHCLTSCPTCMFKVLQEVGANVTLNNSLGKLFTIPHLWGALRLCTTNVRQTIVIYAGFF
jgi:hypothetical protein